MEERAHPDALPEGYTFEHHHYRIEGILGRGGFGITYLAHDVNLDRKVAVKEYLPLDLARRADDSTVHPATGAEADSFAWGLQRFVDEARTLSRFEHPNIVRVYAVFEANRTACMVMRYEEGESLADRLARHETLPEADLRAILDPVLDGLAQVHAQDFIHRDIKPANIFLRADGSPVLIDFGAARQALGRTTAQTSHVTSLVSYGYSPIEQFDTDGRRQGPWTDIYALGATFYHAVTGRKPVQVEVRSSALVSGEPDPLPPAEREAGPGYSPALLRAIDAALALAGKDRPQTVAAWRAMFDATPDDRAPPRGGPPAGRAESTDTVYRPPPAKPAPTAPPPKRGFPVAGVLAGVVGALALAAAGWWLTVGQEGPGVESTPPPPVADGRERMEVAPAPPVLQPPDSEESTPAPPPRVAERPPAAVPPAEAPPAEPLPVEAPRADPSPERVAPAEDPEVARLLRLAQDDLAADPPTLEGLDDARRRLRTVLDLSSGNPMATEGLERVRAGYARLGEEALAWNDEAGAGEALRRLDEMAAGSPEARRLEDGLAALQARREEAARREAAEREAAERARRRAEEVEALLAGADADIEALRLTSPEGSNAAEKLKRARELAPDDPRAQEGLDRIVARYVGLAEGALGRGDVDKARGYISRALSVVPGAPAAQALSERIAEESERRAASERQAEEARRRADRVRDLVGEMVTVRGGEVVIGSPPDELGRFANERRQRVRVKDFLMGRHEVTVARYGRFVEATGRSWAAPAFPQEGSHPAVNVSWNDARAYIDWLNAETGLRFRFPTEAEWEYAARAGTTGAFWWGDVAERGRANCNGCGSAWDGRGTAPVGSFAPNPWGLHDTAGNVLEWTCSAYSDRYDGKESRCAQGSASAERVSRGGAWIVSPRWIRSAARNRAAAGEGNGYTGFRLVRDP